MHTVRPLYTDGKRKSPILRDLIGEQVTINPNFVRNKLIFGNGNKGRNYGVTEHETPFEEIAVVPYEDAFESHKEAFDFKKYQGSRSEVDGRKYLEAFEQVVNSAWDPTKFNLVYQSSGFDSRIIGHFIRQKYKSDPGPILFVCWGAECEAFEQIMSYEGWDRLQYIMFPLDMEMSMYGFNFKDIWKHMNGASWHFSASMYHTSLDYLQTIGMAPKDPADLNIWTGLDNNSMVNWPGSLDDNYKRGYYSWALRMWGVIGGIDTIQPCMDIGVAKVLFTAANRKDKIRREMVALADPKLASFPRTKTSKARVPLADLERMVIAFKQSYYYQNIERVPDPDFKGDIYMYDGRHNHNFWRKWTAASLIEELIRRGVRITG